MTEEDKINSIQEEFYYLDVEAYKFIKSWEHSKDKMKEELDKMVESGDIEQARTREKVIELLEKACQHFMEFRRLFNAIAQRYKLEYIILEDLNINPIEILLKVFNNDYMTIFHNRMKLFVDRVDVDKVFTLENDRISIGMKEE
jgi:polyhydroxyalkanoate synthesis regulator phasin